MWRELVGKWQYVSSTTGTATLPAGATVIRIRAESHNAAGTVTIFGGDSILLNGGATAGAHIVLDHSFNHTLCRATASNKTIVFTNMTSYLIEYITSGYT